MSYQRHSRMRASSETVSVLLRSSSGSLAIFAAIRCALSGNKHDLDQRRGPVVMNDGAASFYNQPRIRSSTAGGCRGSRPTLTGDEEMAQRAMSVAKFAAKYDTVSTLNLTKGVLYGLASGGFPDKIVKAVLKEATSRPIQIERLVMRLTRKRQPQKKKLN
jgi:hypothetical protein